MSIAAPRGLSVPACLLIAASATGEFLDQYQEESNGGSYVWADQYLAQTFTPSISAQLDHIDLEIDSFHLQPWYPTYVDVVTTVDGVPSGDVLGSVYVPAFQMGWYTVDFLPESVFLDAGERYGIVLWNDDPDPEEMPTAGVRIRWWTDPYAGGELWRFIPDEGWSWYDHDGPPGQSDMTFRTWMVPAPSTVAAFGLLGLGRRRRRRMARNAEG